MTTNYIIQPKITPPNDSFLMDEEDEKIRKIFEQMDKKDPSKSAELVAKAIDVIRVGKNPEKEKIISFLHGLHFELLSRAEKENSEKLKLLKKALYFYQHLEETKKEVERIEANILLVEAASRGRHDLYYQVYLKFQKLSDEKIAYFSLGMYYMIKAGSLFGRPEAINTLEEGERAFEKSGLIDGVYKIKSLKFEMLAQYSSSIEEAIVYMKKCIEEINKTSDKYGIELAQSKLLFFEALLSGDDDEKAEKFIKSGELLLKSGFREHKLKAHNLLGKGYSLKTRNSKNSLEEVLKYQKLSIQNYTKGRSTKDISNVKGYYWATIAIKQILVDNDKAFVHFCKKAFEEFKKAGNEREAEYMFGIISLYYSKFLPRNKKNEALEISGNILGKKNLGDFALYELYKSKSEMEPDPIKQREIKQQALKHLDVVLRDLRERKEVYEKFPQLESRDRQLEFLLKSERYQIEASLEIDFDKKKLLYNKASDFLSEIEANQPKLRLAAIENSGWLYIETGDFDKALEKFELAARINPNLESLKENIKYAKELLKTNFRKIKDERELKNKFQEQALGGFLLKEDSLNLRDFVPIVLRTVYERGMLFERAPATYSKKTECELRDEILTDLIKTFGDATAESKVGDGKTDLRVNNPYNKFDKAIGECKWWKGESEYGNAKEQLLRYLPPQQEYGMIVTFVEKKDFNQIIEKAKEKMQQTPDCIEGSVNDFNILGPKKLCFKSRHKFNKGGEIEIYHIFFNLYSEAK